MIKLKRTLWISIFLFLVSLFIFTQGLSFHGLEFRDDEIFYYKSTQEMIQNGNILSPTYFGANRFQKPILYYWMVLFSYKIFGINWFAARFVAVFFAGLTVCLTWWIARELFNEKIAFLSAVILMTTPLFFRHAKNVVPDMPLNFFVVLALYCAIRYVSVAQAQTDPDDQKKGMQKYSILFCMSCALGFLIKGYAAVIIPLGTLFCYLCLQKKIKLIINRHWGWGFLLMSVIVLPWFLYMIQSHGQAYLDHVLVQETTYRLFGAHEAQNILLAKTKSFFQNSGFYIQVIFSYFAPWSIFLLGALPFALIRALRDKKEKESLQWILVWFCFTFVFFSLLFFVINHYMLVLTTPAAILVSFFFFRNSDLSPMSGKIKRAFQKYFTILAFTIYFLVFTFIFIFLVGANKIWLLVLLIVYLVAMGQMIESQKGLISVWILGIFMTFVLSQSTMMGKANLTSHAVLQRFAATIHQERDKNYIVGVGSHDLHEKEFQVYFERRVEKAAASWDSGMEIRLARHFASEKTVYCLMTQQDYSKYVAEKDWGHTEIVQEDYIFRKRMSIDKEFFEALIKLDREKIYHYFMEKLVLVRKERNA